MFAPHTRNVPIFWGHGAADPLIPLQFGVRSAETLKSELQIPEAAPDAPQNGGLGFHTYEGVDHSASYEELRDLVQWLARVIPAE